MPTAAAYIRVSTEDQIEFSPDSQLKMIRAYAARSDLLLPENLIFQDEGISGRSAGKRPAFMQMIGTAKQKPKPFDVILVWKFSRFARNRQDSILYKSMLRKECGIDVVSITEQLSDDPTAILIEALLEAMDEYYSINLAQEVRRGMNEKFSRGGVVSVPPFGYKMGKDRFEIDPDKAPIVGMIFEKFLDGVPYRQIAAFLNAMDIRTNRGNPFEDRTVAYILSNPTYTGKLRRSIDGVDRSDRFLQGGNVILADGAHTPIVTEATFRAAQDRIAEIKKASPAYARTSYADFMLRGLVRCSCCGGTLTQSVRGKTLQCHRYARGQCGESHSVALDRLNRAVLAALAADQADDALVISVNGAKTAVSADAEQVLLDKEYKRLARVKEAYEAGIDSLEEYRRNKAAITERICVLEQRLNRPAPSQRQMTFRGRLKDVLARLDAPAVSEAEKNELLRSFVSKIVFDRKAGTIEVFYGG